MAEKIFTVDNPDCLSGLFGHLDENLNKIRNEYNVSVINRDDTIKIIGNENDIQLAAKAIEALMKINDSGQYLTDQTVRYVTSYGC